MHSVYMTHNPCVYSPSLHVCTQSVQNPASMDGDPVRDGEAAAERSDLYIHLEQARPCQHQCYGP